LMPPPDSDPSDQIDFLVDLANEMETQ